MFFFLQFIVQINNLAISPSLQVNIFLTQSKVQAQSNYQFQINLYDGLSIPADSLIVIQFPDKYGYQTLQQIQATPVIIVYQQQYNGTIQNNNLTINAAFKNGYDKNFSFTILNIRNPKSSGLYTFNFTIKNSQQTFQYFDDATVDIKPGNLNLTAKFSNNQVKTISQLHIQVTPQHQIPSNGKLRIKINKIWSQFPNNRNYNTIQDNTTCSSNANTSEHLRCDIDDSDNLNFKIIVENIFDTDHEEVISFIITINNVLSPPTVLTSQDKFTIETLDASYNTIDKNQVQIQELVATQMNTTFDSTNIIVGTNRTLLQNIIIEFKQIIILNDTIQFKFPQNIIYRKENIQLRDQKNLMSIRYLIDLNDEQKITFIFDSMGPGKQIIQNQTLIMHLIINITIPWTTQPNYIIITFKRNKSQYLNVTGTLTPLTNNLTVQLQPQTKQINKSTKYKFILGPESIMNNSAYLNITFPNQINIQNANNCMKKTNNASEIPCEIDPIQNQSIIIINLFEAGYSSRDQFYVSFENITNPSKVKNFGPFLITTYGNFNKYQIDQNKQLNFTTTYGILDTSKIVIQSDSQVVYQSTIYTIKLTILNEVSIKKSQIHIQFPKQFQIGQLNLCLVNSSICNCQKDTSNQTVILFNFSSTDQTFNSGQEVEIKIGNIRNPKSTQRVNGINIKIYNDCQQQESCNDSNLQDIGLNLFYMVSQPSQLVLTINPQQKTNGQQIKYFFNIYFDYPIENNSILQITFPQSMSVTNNPNCSFQINNIQLPLQCKYQTSTRILTINIKNSTQNILGSYTISVQRIKNAKSFKKNELKLELFLSDGITIVQKSNENFGFTNNKTGQIDIDKTQFSFNSSILGQESKITMNVSIKNSLDSSCFMEVQFPVSYKLSDPLQCNDNRISCSNNLNNILIFQIKQNYTFDDFLYFTVSTITNPFYSLQLIPFKQDFLIKTYQTYQNTNFPIDQGTIPYQFKKQCQNACRTCPSNQLNFCLSCYTNRLITNHNYLQQNQCIQNCNAYYYQQNDICKQCVSPCYTCSNDFICLSCDLSGQYSYYLNLNNSCLENCPVKYFSNTNKICYQCPPECFKCTSQLECSQCILNKYLKDKQCLDKCPPGFFQFNFTQGGNCSKCQQQCQQCKILPNKCTICSNGYINITQQDPNDNTFLCEGKCPNETQAINNNTGQCQDCILPCKTCQISIRDCQSCWHDSSQKFFRQESKRCSDSCSANQYADQNFICKACPGKCLSCNYSNNIIKCSSCQNLYKLQNGECLTSCTPNIYVEDGNECKPCQGQCQTCQISITNCTSCKTLNLDNNSCVQNCNDTKVPINKICTQCQSPCLHCKNTVSNCTKCEAKTYLFQNKCLQNCPNGFYINSVNGENVVCQQCITNCINCSNSYQCIQCYPNYFLQKQICVSQCTQGNEIDNECSPCANKCKKCSHPDACVQCYQGYLLAKDGICYNQCPESYPVLQDNQCVKCPSDCIQCDLKGMCLQCKCVNQCPQFYQLSADKKSCQLILIQNSQNAFTKSPFPILIVTGFCLVSIFVSKFQASQTILTSSIIGIVSIVQLSAQLYLLIIYSSSITQLNKQLILLIIGICFLIILNIVHFMFYFKYLSKDQTFKSWKQKKWNRISNCIVLFFSLFTFKAYHLIYSRYFGFETFSASWKNINLLFPFVALGIISIFLNSIIMIIGASLIAYQQNKKNYFSQVFIQSLEVIIIQALMALMIILLICNFKKNNKMFKCSLQNIQLLKQSSANKKKTMQQSEIYEIKNQTQNFNQNIMPAISKQKLNKVVPQSFQEITLQNKNLNNQNGQQLESISKQIHKK